MGASQAALADIELARKEEEQKLIQAKTLLASANVEAGKTLALANTTADISVEKAVQEVTEAAKADMELAMSEAKEAAGRQCHDMRVQFEREYEELQNR